MSNRHGSAAKKFSLENNPYAIILTIAGALLAPVLTFQISPDLAAFAVGGRVIADGGKIYADYVDIKPPLIYYIFSLIYKISGWSQISLRIWDWAIQMSVCASMVFVARRLFRSSLAALISVMLYCMYYVNAGFGNTFQCESIFAAPLIWIFYLTIRFRKKFYFGAILGLLIAFSFSLKFTFLIIVLPIAFSLFLQYDIKNFLIVSLYVLIGFVAGFLLFFAIPLFDREVFEGFLSMFKFLRAYASHFHFDMGYVKFAYDRTIEFFGDWTSFSVAALIGAAIIGALKTEASSEKKGSAIFLIGLILFLFISVVYERKFFLYHLSRLNAPLSLLAGAGFVVFFKDLRDKFRRLDKRMKVFLAALILIGLFFSPLTRYSINLVNSSFYFADKKRFLQLRRDEENPGTWYYLQDVVSRYFIENKEEGDKLIVIASGMYPVYVNADFDKASYFANAAFYFGVYTPEEWRSLYMKDFEEADWVLTYWDFYDYPLHGSGKTARESFAENKELYDYFQKNFEKVAHIAPFDIYKRIVER